MNLVPLALIAELTHRCPLHGVFRSRWHSARKVRKSPLALAEEWRNGSPAIELNPSTGDSSERLEYLRMRTPSWVGVWMLEPGEDLLVARRLRDVLGKSAG